MSEQIHEKDVFECFLVFDFGFLLLVIFCMGVDLFWNDPSRVLSILFLTFCGCVCLIGT